jgi:Ran GTPase-activating protein (RanGAP) involved in mRNA processing and transport
VELGRILPELRNLHTLILRNCNIGSTYASHIFTGLILNTSLETLDLSNNSVGDIASGSLANLIRTKQDYVKLNIHLRSNQISNAGYEKIK